mmetsp:Transcript_21490/g.66280  ORF Transcript_21490/g.66280 Transcript_21490/m.66280 type:complete len:235 (-) Transcript_21490:152-856(-)|eukprot:CAMPEP_0198650710 /NCGR_PEP_ID=MMETSP1467-20131203/5166_1 /TAXON_ID=1462469 /ORGANISM="unid. sp., Strain CCMP2135" /LENGTH=234 /DNA_ID=CAMNT_0044386569 /DNA_START=40 /DNA_END=744 /DNA_ORIENTATION=-
MSARASADAAATKTEVEVVNDDGLEPAEKAKTEKEARSMYFKVQFVFLFVIAPLLASAAFWAATKVSNEAVIVRKLKFLREYDLGYAYAAWYFVFLGKTYASISAVCARAPARVGRPDQFIYRAAGEKKGPYVLMVSDDGPMGRFNRAQRASANLDENLPLFVTGLLLNTAVLGKVGLALGLLYFLGACKFAEDYKTAAKQRGPGFLLGTIIPSQTSAALVALLAVIALFPSSF